MPKHMQADKNEGTAQKLPATLDRKLPRAWGYFMEDVARPTVDELKVGGSFLVFFSTA